MTNDAKAEMPKEINAEEIRSVENEKTADTLAKEIGGQKGPEPTRYGDWEKGGIISDF